MILLRHWFLRRKQDFTIGIAATYSDKQQSLLFKTGCNDTVFRISDHKIMPACVLNLQNSDQEIIRCLDATDFSSLHQKFGGNKDIFVSDLFETPRSYYFRCRYDGGHYVVSVDKETGKILAEHVSSLKVFLNFLMPIFFLVCWGHGVIVVFPFGAVWRKMVCGRLSFLMS